MRVKICGIRRIEDAIVAAHLGADAIGLLVGQRHRSDDFLSPQEAHAIAERCPPLITPVLVTHLEQADEVAELAREIGLLTIQMHSDCSVEVLMKVRRHVRGARIIRAVHATGPAVVDEMLRLEAAVDAFVLDSKNTVEDRVGGTGLTHDWNLSRRAVREVGRPIILAGGLNPANVGRAIRIVRPYGVDANTGLRDTTGLKSPTKMAAFLREARRAFGSAVRPEEAGP